MWPSSPRGALLFHARLGRGKDGGHRPGPVSGVQLQVLVAGLAQGMTIKRPSCLGRAEEGGSAVKGSPLPEGWGAGGAARALGRPSRPLQAHCQICVFTTRTESSECGPCLGLVAGDSCQSAGPRAPPNSTSGPEAAPLIWNGLYCPQFLENNYALLLTKA